MKTVLMQNTGYFFVPVSCK